jgi:hypothetical protein
MQVISMVQDMSFIVPLRETIAFIWRQYFLWQGMPDWGNDTSIHNFQTDVLPGSNAMIYGHVANSIVAVFNFEKHGYEDNNTTYLTKRDL